MQILLLHRKSNKSIDWTKFMNRQTKSKLNEDWKEWLCKSFISYQMRKSFLIRYMSSVIQNASRKNITVLITIQMHISFFRINIGIHFQLYYSLNFSSSIDQKTFEQFSHGSILYDSWSKGFWKPPMGWLLFLLVKVPLSNPISKCYLFQPCLINIWQSLFEKFKIKENSMKSSLEIPRELFMGVGKVKRCFERNF